MTLTCYHDRRRIGDKKDGPKCLKIDACRQTGETGKKMTGEVFHLNSGSKKQGGYLSALKDHGREIELK